MRKRTNTKRAWGRHYLVDDRDGNFMMARPTTFLPSAARYWNSKWVGDQGSTPHCVGFAWAGWLDAPPVKHFLIPEGIYSFAQTQDEWSGTEYEGTSVRGAAKALASLGVIKEYRWAVDPEAVALHVLDEGPVVIGVNWYTGMSYPEKVGRESVMRVNGRRLGGHAVLIDGVNTLREVFRVKNSWGKSWGTKGHAMLGIEDLRRLIGEDGEACVGVDVIPKP